VVSVAINAIADQPLQGYGLNRLRQILPITPHNEIILLWISSGIVPAILYLSYVAYMIVQAFRLEKVRNYINPLPMVVYVVMGIPLTNLVLPKLWAVCAVCYLFAIIDAVKTRPPSSLRQSGSQGSDQNLMRLAGNEPRL